MTYSYVKCLNQTSCSLWFLIKIKENVFFLMKIWQEWHWTNLVVLAHLHQWCIIYEEKALFKSHDLPFISEWSFSCSLFEMSRNVQNHLNVVFRVCTRHIYAVKTWRNWVYKFRELSSAWATTWISANHCGIHFPDATGPGRGVNMMT